MAVPSGPLQEKSSTPIAMSTSQIEHKQAGFKTNYKQKLTSAANSIVNFAVSTGGDIGGGGSGAMSKESMDSLDRLSKVSQMCVNDMIKYSMDLFTVSGILRVFV